MSIIPGIVFSRARWRAIRKRNDTMDREIYLDNDHLIDYRLEERTTGKFISDLQLSASLSRNPTGSAVTSSFLGGPTSSFVSAVVVTQSVQTIISGPTTQSILTLSSQSIFTNFSGSNVGAVTLATVLTEDPPCSGHYSGIIRGADISTALSASFSESFSGSFSSSVTTASQATISVSSSGAGFLTESLQVTMSVSGFTSSFTASAVLPLAESPDRCQGIHEIIQSGSFLKAATPMNLRSVRFIP